MDKKLTLSLNQEIIEKAKVYAKENKTSLSQLIENYFNSITNEIQHENEIESTPLVDSLCGIITLPKDYIYHDAKAKYLMDKYK